MLGGPSPWSSLVEVVAVSGVENRGPPGPGAHSRTPEDTGPTVDAPGGMNYQSGDWGSSVEGRFRGRA